MYKEGEEEYFNSKGRLNNQPNKLRTSLNKSLKLVTKKKIESIKYWRSLMIFI